MEGVPSGPQRGHRLAKRRQPHEQILLGQLFGLHQPHPRLISRHFHYPQPGIDLFALLALRQHPFTLRVHLSPGLDRFLRHSLSRLQLGPK